MVKPEMVSKYALVKSLIYPLMMKGREPNRLKMIQVRVTSRYASRLPNEFSDFLPRNRSPIPPISVRVTAMMNAMESSSLM